MIPSTSVSAPMQQAHRRRRNSAHPVTSCQRFFPGGRPWNVNLSRCSISTTPYGLIASPLIRDTMPDVAPNMADNTPSLADAPAAL